MPSVQWGVRSLLPRPARPSDRQAKTAGGYVSSSLSTHTASSRLLIRCPYRRKRRNTGTVAVCWNTGRASSASGSVMPDRPVKVDPIGAWLLVCATRAESALRDRLGCKVDVVHIASCVVANLDHWAVLDELLQFLRYVQR